MWEKQGDVTAWAPALNRFDDIMVAYARQKGLYPRGGGSTGQKTNRTSCKDVWVVMTVSGVQRKMCFFVFCSFPLLCF